MNHGINGELRAYRREISRVLATGQATEHSYRAGLQALVQALGGDEVHVVNEPSHVACGAPDFIVERRGMPIGHIECKDIGADLERIQANEQLTRYRAGLPNLVLTDYLEFRWYAYGDWRGTVRVGNIDGKGDVKAGKLSVEKVAQLFESFLEADPPTVADPKELASRMAAKAGLLRDTIERILHEEGRLGSFGGMLEAYRDVLISDLSEEAFADLQAQTAAYGLFAARCLHDTNTGPFTRQTAIFADTTPFLRNVFGLVAGPEIDKRIVWIVDDLALLLDRANMSEILKNFGRGTRRQDPMVHFYEDFLASYDPKLREVRGVYYTPEPVVSYIVRSIDLILRSHFDLSDGLADSSTLPDGANPVLILDPAVGTGTFLREVVSLIRATINQKGLSGAWSDYVSSHLLPRLFGFELLMAPYAICHLKLALEIGGTEQMFRMPDGQRLSVFLTNTLEEPHERTTGRLFAHEIAREAASAYNVKREKPVMVILGNPPYSGHSANKGAWIVGLIDSYKDGFPELKKPAQSKWLSDDYVKFIRFAQWRIERTGEGVLGFVTNHAYLDNPTFRGMRRSLMETFDEVYLLDLHGNAKTNERTPRAREDENVFDIQQGVAIGLFVKRSNSGVQLARVFHHDRWGRREGGPTGGKYGWLDSNDISTTKWTELSPKPPFYLFRPRDEELSEEYESAWSIPEIFSISGDPAPGIVTTHDQFAISWTPEDAKDKVVRLLATKSEDEARRIWRLCSQNQWQYDRAKQELSLGSWKPHIASILYRPFDTRTTIFERNVAVHRRERVMRHMRSGPNLGLCIGRSGHVVGSEYWDIVIATNLPSDYNLFRRGGNCLFPLYTYHFARNQHYGSEPQPNLDSGFVEDASASFGLDFVPGQSGDLETTFGPMDVFHYIYAVLYSPNYRRRYADFLMFDFPRVPLTRDRVLFRTLVVLGQELATLHLMKQECEGGPAFPIRGSNRVDRVRYVKPSSKTKQGRVWINSDQYFEGIASETWAFAIGGYRPAEKWLRDRRNRVLSYLDVAHYRSICAALTETRQVMAGIDRAVENHGGWPLKQVD